jgi:hypothetical protein
MQLIFDRSIAEDLQKNHTVLELETVTKDGVTLDVFCLIPVEKIALTEMAQLQHNTKLHTEFVNAYKNSNYQLCKDLYTHILGKFGGEVDTFYSEIIQRIDGLIPHSSTE